MNGRSLLRDRAQWFAFIGLLDAGNGFFTRLAATWQTSDLQAFLFATGGVSFICWFALWAIAMIALEPAGDEPAGLDPLSRHDRIVLTLMTLGAFAPVSLAGSLGLLLGGLWLMVTGKGLSRTRRIGAIFLALTGTLIWGKLLLELVPAVLLDFDAALAGLLAGVEVTGNMLQFRGASGGIIVMGGCSSLHNMSLAVLLWVTLGALLRQPPSRAQWISGGLAVLAMLAVNSIRLAAIATHPAQFELLHTGMGAEAFSLAGLLLAGFIIVVGYVVSTRART
jgi:exosortase/archaeosortase family protein